MFSAKKNLIKSILLVILTSSLPINNAKANIFERFMGNPFSGKWCATRIIDFMGGEDYVPLNDIPNNCYIFKKGGALIAQTTEGNIETKYQVLDKETALIIRTDGGQTILKYDRDRKEIYFTINQFGILGEFNNYGNTTLYFKKQ